jgi:hypothetical protein
MDRTTRLSSAFNRAYAAWSSVPIRGGAKTDAIDELHAELAYVDHLVAASVIPFANGKSWDVGAVEVVGQLDALDAKIEDALRTVDEDDRELAEGYRRYAALMRDVFLAGRSAAGLDH